jgi:hypothetical protein
MILVDDRPARRRRGGLAKQLDDEVHEALLARVVVVEYFCRAWIRPGGSATE